MNIRKELADDIQNIWHLNVNAFETDAEANLVNVLRNSGIPYISLVAEENDEITGHILFTPVTFSGPTPEPKIVGLGPMAVLKNRQRSGVGSMLVKAGIKRCISENIDAIVVLGHPEFYPKFGFVPAVQYGITSEYDVPDDVFMFLELKTSVLQGKSGVIKYHKAFSSA